MQFPRFQPFPRNSINLIIGPSSVGKTFYVNQLLNNYKIFFTPPVGRILYILCNSRVTPIPLNGALGIPVEVIAIEDFDSSMLGANDVVVIDDLQNITDSVRDVITVCAHHDNLSALFVITHSLLGNKNFELLQLVHRVFLFMRATSNTRLAKYIVNHFYQDPDIKSYLSQVLSFGQKTKQVIALEINPIANKESLDKSEQPTQFLGFSHLTNMIHDGYCLVYPYPNVEYESSSAKKRPANFSFKLREKRARMTFIQENDSDFEETGYEDHQENDVVGEPGQHNFRLEAMHFPPMTLVAVSAEYLDALLKKAGVNDKDKGKLETEDCKAKKKWLLTNRVLETLVEDYIHSDKWKKAKNIVREILRNSRYCITEDGRTIFRKDKPSKSKISLIDFLLAVLRRAGPRETLNLSNASKRQMHALFSMYVKELIARGAPAKLFDNRLFLPKHLQ